MMVQLIGAINLSFFFNLKRTAIIFVFGSWITSFEVTIIYVVKFLITCLVSEILKDINDKDTIVIRDHGYSKKSMI